MVSRNKQQIQLPEPERSIHGSQQADANKNLFSDSSGMPPVPPKPLYFGDIDAVMKEMSGGFAMVDTERIYLWELEMQKKVYIAFMCLGGCCLAFGYLLALAP